VALRNIAVLRDPRGKPYIECAPELAAWLAARGVTAHHVSLSDEGDLVLAFVVLEQSRLSGECKVTLGPLMLDVAGTELTDDDRRRLAHPLVGGVILFSRNYRDPAQLAALTAEIHALKSAPLLIGVDHEGGRVQRFREGFTRLPPMRAFGEIWNDHPQRARELARETGYVLASELRAHGVDFSFAPVLDLDYGASSVIGDRSFHADPHAVFQLGQAVMLGMKDAGMAACGKHFPGHGFVKADSHVAIPVDERTLADITIADLVPFRLMIEAGLAAVMPAHVIYPQVDEQPAGFSRYGCRSCCATNWASTARFSATTCAWKAPPWRAAWSNGWQRRSTPAATWRWCATAPTWPTRCWPS
jgi:hypothetical protein